MLGEIAHQRSLAAVAEAGHAMLHVRDEALARLLPVVADVDTDVALRRDARTRRVGHRRFELGIVDRLASASATVELGERLRAGEAAGVGDQDAALAREHGEVSRG